MLAPFVLLPFAVGALGGYGLSFLGLFGRIVCAGILFIHALLLLLALLARLGAESGAPEHWLGDAGMTEYLAMALAFDSAMILSGRLSGLTALDWRRAGGAAMALVTSIMLARRHMSARQRRFASQRPG